jgi:hypothetical protein
VSALSICHVSLSDILLACFAHSRVMLLPEVFQTSHPNFDVISADWASYFAIGDDEVSSLVLLRAR